jgi:hypothetical protein
VVGHYTNDLIYDRIIPGLREEIFKYIPKNANGKPKGKLHSMLTVDYGHPKLIEHLTVVTAFMRGATDWASFMTLLDRALPRFGEMRLLDAPLLNDGGMLALPVVSIGTSVTSP